MKYTENYHLPQWVKTDRIMMDDFNAAMADIEQGLTKNRTEAAAGIAEASKMPYTIGTYTGDGGTKDVYIGFRPSFLIISGQKAVGDNPNEGPYVRYIAFTAGGLLHERLTITDTGFRVYPLDLEHLFFPTLNEKDRLYEFIAFR